MNLDEGNKIGPGGLILVVGPSGCGKDTLLRGAREKLSDRPEYVFPRRMITRPSDPDSEDSLEITWQEFASMRSAGECSVCWEAHGLGYGLPNTIIDDIGAGRTVIFNCSRTVLPDLEQRYQNAFAVQITVSRDILKTRLMDRGRESEKDIQERLNRANFDLPSEIPRIEIDNSGTTDAGSEALAQAIKDFHRSILNKTARAENTFHS